MPWMFRHCYCGMEKGTGWAKESVQRLWSKSASLESDVPSLTNAVALRKVDEETCPGRCFGQESSTSGSSCELARQSFIIYDLGPSFPEGYKRE
jgi:hypothetical protein